MGKKEDVWAAWLVEGGVHGGGGAQPPPGPPPGPRPPAPLRSCPGRLNLARLPRRDISLNVALETMKAAADEGHLHNEHAVGGAAVLCCAVLCALGGRGSGSERPGGALLQPSCSPPPSHTQIRELAKSDEHLRRYIHKHM